MKKIRKTKYILSYKAFSIVTICNGNVTVLNIYQINIATTSTKQKLKYIPREKLCYILMIEDIYTPMSVYNISSR